jgi:anti-sigma B factor antagonist/stage II sporulation protein AA (anti-sigma F factor antagonist)
MRLLLSITKRMNTNQGRLLLFSIHEDVMEIIRMAGFEQILHIYSDEQKALASS